MMRAIFAFRSFPAALAMVLSSLAVIAGPASAGSQRTFVASTGIDSGNLTCSLVNPCRSFNTAIANTNVGGEVVILDTAGYGPMVINKSIKIIGPTGVYGGISVQGGGSGITTGIVINAGDTDDITLRGLDVSGVPGAVGPFPLIGIDIQNAGAVHIEKSSVGNFPEDGGGCIGFATAKTLRLYIVDSFLRHCLRGIVATGSTVSGNRSSVMVDNTRIERGFNSNAASQTIGVLMQGFVAVSLRNSIISRYTAGIQFDSNLATANNTLDIINSELSNLTTGVVYFGTGDTGTSQIRVAGSQITNVTNEAINVNNSALGRNTFLTIGDSVLAYAGRLVALTNNSTDTINARMVLEMDNTRVLNASAGVSIDLNSPNNAKTHAFMRDSTFAQGGNVVKTRGGAQVSASLIRSEVNNCAIVIDHGAGVVRLQENHIVNCSDDFVNNGSGNIVSDMRNVVHDIPNSSGFTYITPTPVPLK